MFGGKAVFAPSLKLGRRPFAESMRQLPRPPPAVAWYSTQNGSTARAQCEELRSAPHRLHRVCWVGVRDGDDSLLNKGKKRGFRPEASPFRAPGHAERIVGDREEQEIINCRVAGTEDQDCEPRNYTQAPCDARTENCKARQAN